MDPELGKDSNPPGGTDPLRTPLAGCPRPSASNRGFLVSWGILIWELELVEAGPRRDATVRFGIQPKCSIRKFDKVTESVYYSKYENSDHPFRHSGLYPSARLRIHRQQVPAVDPDVRRQGLDAKALYALPWRCHPSGLLLQISILSPGVSPQRAKGWYPNMVRAAGFEPATPSV